MRAARFRIFRAPRDPSYMPFPVHPMSAGVHWCVSHVNSFCLTYLRAHTHAVAIRGTENPYYMYTYLYIAYSARTFGPARLATLAVLHICWTS
jgi:hypothetical protein